METGHLSQSQLIAAIEGAVETAVARALEKQEQPAHPPEDPLTWSDDRLCTRKEAEAYAQATGNPVSKWMLDKFAVSGEGGPPIRYFDRKPLYQLGEFKAWLTSRTRKARSTAELRRTMQIEAAA